VHGEICEGFSFAEDINNRDARNTRCNSVTFVNPLFLLPHRASQ